MFRTVLLVLTGAALGCDDAGGYGLGGSGGGGGECGSGGSITVISGPTTGATATAFCVAVDGACDDVSGYPCCDAVYCDEGTCNPCRSLVCRGTSCELTPAADGTPCGPDGTCSAGVCVSG